MKHPFDFTKSMRSTTDLLNGGAFANIMRQHEERQKLITGQLTASSMLANFDPAKYGTTNIIDMSRFSTNIVSDSIASMKLPSTVVADTVTRWFDASSQPAYKVVLPDFKSSLDITQLIKPALSSTILDQAFTTSARSAGLAALVGGRADAFRESASIIQQAMAALTAKPTLALASSRFTDLIDQQRAALDLVGGNHRTYAGAMSLAVGQMPKIDFASVIGEPVVMSRLLASMNVSAAVADQAFIEGDEEALGKIMEAAIRTWAEAGVLYANQKGKWDEAGVLERMWMVFMVFQACNAMLGFGMGAYELVADGADHVQDGVSAIVRHFEQDDAPASAETKPAPQGAAEAASGNAIPDAAELAAGPTPDALAEAARIAAEDPS